MEDLDKDYGMYTTIGEASKIVGVPQHVIRFWENKFHPYIKLTKINKRRYFGPQDIDLIKEIKELLYFKGYTIKGTLNHLKSKNKKSHTPNNDNSDIVDSLRAIKSSLVDCYNQLKNLH